MKASWWPTTSLRPKNRAGAAVGFVEEQKGDQSLGRVLLFARTDCSAGEAARYRIGAASSRLPRSCGGMVGRLAPRLVEQPGQLFYEGGIDVLTFQS